MKSVLINILGVPTNVLWIIAALAIIAIFGQIKVISYLKSKRKQRYATLLGSEHVGRYFKIIKIEHGVVLLGLDPTTEWPSGIGEVWFKSDKIPVELLEELSVIHVEDNSDGGIIVNKGPTF